MDSNVNWGAELWDRYESVSSHTNRGVEFLEKYGQFVKERSSIESDYASKLRRLVKSYLPRKKDDDENQYSSNKAFISMLNEVNDIAGQHEVMAENFMTDIVKEVHNLIKEIKEERKKYLREGENRHSQLQNALILHDKAKKAYEKTFREAEKSQESYVKADADINLSRAEVEKARIFSNAKNQLCEEAKTNYADQLQKTNEIQRIHFFEAMPQIFQNIQDMDERRISCFQNFLKTFADIHKQVIPIINKCLEGIIVAAKTIDTKQDSKLVIERFKTGFSPPEDLPFEDLSNIKSTENNTNSQQVPTVKVETIKGSVSLGKPKKRHGLFGIFVSKHASDDYKDDFSDLPPAQRKKKLQQKVEQIQVALQQESAARDGLLKMKQVYETNRGLGDPESVEGQLHEQEQKLHSLQTELQKYQGYLADTDITTLTPVVQKKIQNSLNLDNALSRSASESCVINARNFKISTPETSHGSYHSQDGINNDVTVQPSEDIYASPDPEFENIDDFDDSDSIPLPAIGTAKALYDFDGQSEGSVCMEEHEDLLVIEVDQGDGWTRVRKNTSEEGFVPTSYIEISIHQSEC